MSKIGNAGVQRNSAATVGVEPIINVIEGANITLAVAHDPANERINITITGAAGGGAGDLEQYFPASDPDNNKGRHPSMLMADAMETTVRQSFYIPGSVVTLTEAVVVVIPDAGGNLDWECVTHFGQLCANEQYDTHPDSTTGTTAVTNGEIECIDISAALTGAAARDLVGIEFKRDGDDAADTVDADVHFIGIYVKGSGS